VASQVALVRSVRISHVWLLSDAEGRRFLVDSGHRAERFALARGLARLHVRGPGDLEAVLLTHRHSDHAGNAAWLHERFRCPVLCHQADAPFLEGHTPPPPLAHRGAPLVHDLLCRLEDRLPALSAVDRTFAEGPLDWGFRAIHVGGHTEGSSLLLHEPTETLFTGDALLAGPPVQRTFVRLRLSRPEYSLDVTACRKATLAYLSSAPTPTTLCCGHGPIVARRVSEHLARLQARTALSESE